jgi:GNAT superfamily N-acetyltransferase
VTKIRLASPAEATSWLDDYRGRLLDWYGRFSDVPGWAEHFAGLRCDRWQASIETDVFVVRQGDAPAGWIALAMPPIPSPPTLYELWIAPEFRGQGHGKSALAFARRWAGERGRKLSMTTWPGDPAGQALFGGFPVQAIQMVKKLVPQELSFPGVSVHAMTQQEFVPWQEEQMLDYIRQTVESGTLGHADAEKRAREAFAQLLPDGAASAGCTLLSVKAGGEVVATNWLGHAFAPGMTWVNGVQVYEGHRGKGYGRMAMLFGEQATLAAGEKHLGLNVFGPNTVAIRLYESLDYRAFDVFRHVPV